MTRLLANRTNALISGSARSLDELDRRNGGRSRVLAILRLATRVLGMKRRSIGRLGSGGAAIAALLMSIGLGVSGVQAQTVVGGGTTAANGSTAVGVGAIAIGGGAVASRATSSSGDAIAIGDQAVASGPSSIAIGPQTSAPGLEGIAIGHNAVAGTGTQSLAVGAFRSEERRVQSAVRDCDFVQIVAAD